MPSNLDSIPQSRHDDITTIIAAATLNSVLFGTSKAAGLLLPNVDLGPQITALNLWVKGATPDDPVIEATLARCRAVLEAAGAAVSNEDTLTAYARTATNDVLIAMHTKSRIV